MSLNGQSGTVSRSTRAVLFPLAIVVPFATYQLLVNHLPAWVVLVSCVLGWIGASLVALRVLP